MLAYLRRRGDQSTLETFPDAGFAEDWGDSPRQNEAGSRLVEESPGVLRQIATCPRATGLGFNRATVGGATHECIRVVDLQVAPCETGVLVEAFINCKGRTVLFGRYNGRLWPGTGIREWDRVLPDNQVLVVDGVRYVH